MQRSANLLFLCLLYWSGPVSGIEPRPDGSWVPVVDFDFEGSSPKETMIWISGWSLALTSVAFAEREGTTPRLFCTSGRGGVESRVLLTILNDRFKGQRINAEQATVALWEGVKKHYPCVSASHG